MPFVSARLVLLVGSPLVLGVAYLWIYKAKERPWPWPRCLHSTKTFSGESTTLEVSTIALQGQDNSSSDQAQEVKKKGNKYFMAGKYDKAIRYYTKAITLCPGEREADLSTFYQNRAAAYEQLSHWMEVVQDCSQALELNPRYVKALFRRAKALERLDKKQECLEDATAVCILEVYQNEQSINLAERVLRLLAKEKAQDKYKNRELMMPSPQFVRSYFSSFTDDVISQKRDEGELSEGNEGSAYLNAKRYMEEENYDEVICECTKEIDAGGKHTAEALLLRATFYLLSGKAASALPDLDSLIDMQGTNVKLCANALIKRGIIYMQQEQSLLATHNFNMAVEIDRRNRDVYHHRGQLKLLLDQLDDAIADFDQCLLLRPDCAQAQAQKCFVLYRKAFAVNDQDQVQKAMGGFEDVIGRFPECADAYRLYAQALTDQLQFAKADEMYDKCIVLEPDNAMTYVHKGCLQQQWTKDLDASLDLISKAIEVDNKCEFAYETMGHFEFQRGNLDKAIEMFNNAINFAKSERELFGLYSLCDTLYSHREVERKYGLRPPIQ